MKLKHLLWLCLVLSSCRPSAVDPELLRLDSLVWYQPDTVLARLAERPAAEPTPREAMLRTLIEQHARNRAGYSTSPDSVMPEVIFFFDKHHDEANLCKAYYVQGTSYMYQHDNTSASAAIYEAEKHIEALEDSSLYAALILYCRGCLSEQHLLYAEAGDAYRRALPYADRLRDPYRQACFYRDAARMALDQNDSLTRSYWDRAYTFARQTGDTLLYCDIRLQQLTLVEPTDSLALYTYSRYMVDSLAQPTYAVHVMDYLLRHDRADEAAPYMQYFTACFNFDRFYDKQGRMTQYQYQATMDRLNLRLQRQRLWLLIAGVVVLLLLTLSAGGWIVYREHQRQRRMEQQWQSRRQMLQVRLRERLTMLDEGTEWKGFVQDFDAAYDGLLHSVQERYPDLTEVDLQYIALRLMHFDTADICMLLGISKRTIYNRRFSIRQRLNLSDDRLDAWIYSLPTTVSH